MALHGLKIGLPLVALAWAANATAQPVETSMPFSKTPLSEAALNQVRGTAAPYTMLTHGALVRIADLQARSDFRLVGSVGGVEMDIWWGTIGSALVANAVRGL